MAYIYIITNKINNKKYIGQTIQDIKRRLYQHKKCLQNTLVQTSIKKYGWENFNKFYFHCPEFLLDLFERALIKLLNTLSPNGYNLDTGGNKNKKISEETRKNLSESHKGQVPKVVKGRVPWNKGKKYSKKLCKKFSEAHIGKMIGEKHPGAKKVICLDTQEIYNTIKEAGLKNNTNDSNIGECCSKRRVKAGGYHWDYYTEGMYLPTKKELESLDLNAFKNKNDKIGLANGKKIQCVETGEVFNSIIEVFRLFKFKNRDKFLKCLNDGKLFNNFHWVFFIDKNQEAS